MALLSPSYSYFVLKLLLRAKENHPSSRIHSFFLSRSSTVFNEAFVRRLEKFSQRESLRFSQGKNTMRIGTGLI
jgi:hypothetical protein